MKKISGYKLQNKTNKLGIFKNKKFDGYNLTKKGKKIINGAAINNLLVIDEVFIKNVINKKIEKKFKKLLELIACICEDDTDPNSSMMQALNESEKFKRIVFNQYDKYLEQKQLLMLEKKILLVEEEIKRKLLQYNQKYENKIVESEKKSHRHR